MHNMGTQDICTLVLRPLCHQVSVQKNDIHPSAGVIHTNTQTQTHTFVQDLHESQAADALELGPC